MTWRYPRVIKVVCVVVRHADLLHHAAGREIGGNREGDDFGERQILESVSDDALRGFRRDSPAPVCGGESPADLDTRREVSFEGGGPETGVADELTFKLQSVRAEAALLEMRENPVDEVVAFLRREECRHVLHDAWIGVHSREGLTIAVAPAAKDESLGGERFEHAALIYYVGEGT